MRLKALLAVLAVLAFSSAAAATTWHIRPDGTGDVTDIRAAVYSASNGDTLLLADGTYTGYGNTEVSYLGKSIVITSASGDPQACIIDCQGGPTMWRRGFLFYHNEDSESVLEAVTIENGYGYEGGAIWCWDASPTIRNVICVGNYAQYYGGAVYCGGVSSPSLVDVTLYGSAAGQGGGLFCGWGGSPSVENTIIAFGKAGGAVFVTDSKSTPHFECSDIYGNAGGDWEGGIIAQWGQSGNISLDPLFCLDDSPESPYGLYRSSPCASKSSCGLVGAAGVACWSGVSAVVDLEPDVIQPESGGKWVTCYIELPDGYSPEDIFVSTVRLNAVVPASPKPVEVGDFDDDEVPDLMVKFDRGDAVRSIFGFGDVGVTVSGEVAGQAFAGSDTVRVLQHDPEAAPSDDACAGREPLSLGITSGPSGEQSIGIRMTVPAQGRVRLTVYDVRGRFVSEVLDEVLSRGDHVAAWDRRDASGTRVASGVYFVHLESGNEVVKGKVLIAR